jgi:hypothetical protein
MDQFSVTEIGGLRVLEGPVGAPLLMKAADVSLLLESCFASSTRAILLHAENLPAAFFDLSSGVAGEMLQKLRTYGGYRLAVVASSGGPKPSSRFAEMEAEERWKGHFALCDSVPAAHEWLTRR